MVLGVIKYSESVITSLLFSQVTGAMHIPPGYKRPEDISAYRLNSREVSKVFPDRLSIEDNLMENIVNGCHPNHQKAHTILLYRLMTEDAVMH